MLSTKSRRCLMGIPVSGIGLALAAGSVAWACTPQGGQTFVTPESGERGSTFTATAKPMPPGAYDLAWLDADSKVVGTRFCHHSTEIVGAGVSDGTTATGVGTVPLTAKDGPAEVCFSGSNVLTYSQPAIFTVAGGLGPVG